MQRSITTRANGAFDMIKINTAETEKYVPILRCGDEVLLSGTVYTARDAAHKKIKELIEKGEPLPFGLEGAAVYYAGPTPAKNGLAVGSCGPTTSSRMDPYAPLFIEKGLAFMIGKGERSEKVKEAMKKYGAVYFCAIGGAGALASKCIAKCDVIAFPELGCESVKKMEFVDFPLIVGVDTYGNSIFDIREKS